MDQPDSRRVIRLLVAGGVCLLAMLMVYWWMTNFVLVKKERRVDISPEVFSNPYYAASRFLERYGKQTRTLTSLMHINDLSDAVDVFLLMDVHSEIPEQQYERLLEWVNHGGHLILEANFLWGDFDEDTKHMKLLDHLDLQLVDLDELVYETDSEATDEYEDDEDEYDEYEDAIYEEDGSDSEVEDTDGAEDTDETGTPATGCGPGEGEWLAESSWNLVNIDFGGIREAVVAFPAAYILLPKAEEPSLDISRYAGESMFHLVERSMGAGKVTVISDSDIWTNPYVGGDTIELIEEDSTDPYNLEGQWDMTIEDLDHAYLLWLLVEDAKAVWMLQDMDYPTLAGILWKYFPQAVLALLALSVAWLWWLNNAFGPLRAEPGGSRRSLLEHLNMSARFEWNADRSLERVKSSRQQLQRELYRKHPRLARLSAHQRDEALASLTGLSHQQVGVALSGGWSNESGFIEITSYIQRIRQKL